MLDSTILLNDYEESYTLGKFILTYNKDNNSLNILCKDVKNTILVEPTTNSSLKIHSVHYKILDNNKK